MTTFNPDYYRDLCRICAYGKQPYVEGSQQSHICSRCGGPNGGKNPNDGWHVDWITLILKIVIIVPFALFMLIFAPHVVALFVFLTVIGVALGNMFGADWDKM